MKNKIGLEKEDIKDLIKDEESIEKLAEAYDMSKEDFLKELSNQGEAEENPETHDHRGEKIKARSRQPEYFFSVFDDAKGANGERINRITDNVAYYTQNESFYRQHTEETPWVVDVNTPYSKVVIDKRVGSLLSNDYKGEFEPLSPEDVESVSKLQKFYSILWKEAKLNSVIKDGLEKVAYLGDIYIHVTASTDEIHGGTGRKRQGKLNSYLIDPENVLIDPDAEKFEDAEYVIIVESITGRKLSREYPEVDVSQLRDRLTSQDRGNIHDHENSSQNDFFKSGSNGKYSKLTFYENINGFWYRTVLIGDEIVEETEAIPLKKLPIAQLKWDKIHKSPYGVSLMTMLLPLQKAINGVESGYINSALLNAAPPLIIDRRYGIPANIIAEYSTSPNAVIAVNGDPKGFSSPLTKSGGLDKNLGALREDLKNDMEYIAGLSNQFLGSLGTSGNTTGGSQIATSRSKIVENKILSNIETTVICLSEIVKSYIDELWSGTMVYTRSDEPSEGEYEFDEFEIPEEISSTEVAFKVNMKVKTEEYKERKLANLSELYQNQHQYQDEEKVINQADLIEAMDLPNKSSLLKRHKQMLEDKQESKHELLQIVITQGIAVEADQELVRRAIDEILNGLPEGESSAVDQIVEMYEELLSETEGEDPQTIRGEVAGLNPRQGSLELEETEQEMDSEVLNLDESINFDEEDASEEDAIEEDELLNFE